MYTHMYADKCTNNFTPLKQNSQREPQVDMHMYVAHGRKSLSQHLAKRISYISKF